MPICNAEKAFNSVRLPHREPFRSLLTLGAPCCIPQGADLLLRPEALARRLTRRAGNQSGQPLTVVAQTAPMSALDYERLVFHEARLPMRRGSLHDLLNLCMWCLWPRSKAALNALHVHRGWKGQERSAAGNAGTLLDECGVVVISTRPETQTLNRQHQWNRLFVHQRSSWGDEVVALPLGHGLLEQLIKPYDGLMGKAVYLQRSSPLNTSGPHPGPHPGPSSAPTPDPAVGLTTDLMTRLIALADGEIAIKIEQLNATRQLLPLPVLGIPGWHSHNTDPGYYRNRQYFRPAPSEHPVG